MTDNHAPTPGESIAVHRRRRSTDPVAGSVEDITPSMDSLLEFVVKMNASDLHIAAGAAPTAVQLLVTAIGPPSAPF